LVGRYVGRSDFKERDQQSAKNHRNLRTRRGLFRPSSS
jgi:hypothetical protein